MSKVINTVAAAAIGFAAGILLAPKSGKETRQDIKDKAAEAKDVAKTKSQQAKAAAEEAKEHMKSGAAKVEREARGMGKSVKNSASVIAEEASSLGAEAKVRGGRAADASRVAANHVKADAKRNLK